ncbi:hypothetical protein HYV81_05060 [Candidatus Woesearchaeota archaeon]|nr:hypothetical protein [Candidatus Woesearchaeota archaeon]
MNPKTWVECKISKVVQETPDTVTIRVALPEHESIQFIPGQYVMFGFLNGEESSRSKAYSISSSPSNTKWIEITVKKEGPFSTRMTKLQVGDKVKIRGPIGHFVFKDDYKQDIMLIAGGTGIAPLRSMWQYIIERELPNNVKLLFSTKIPEDIIYKQELEELKKHNKNVQVTVTLTRVQDGWDGRKGRIDWGMINEHVTDFKNTLFFICGPDAMVNDLQKALRDNGAAIGQVKIEKWGIQ